MSYRVLLFYAYAPVADPEAALAAQRALCEQLSLRGRMIIAKEGINATLSGTKAATETYMHRVSERKEKALGPAVPLSDFKQAPCAAHLFPRLRIRVRKEIVRADLPPWSSEQPRGRYLSPHELRNMLAASAKDLLLLDVRDDYEHQLGHFKGAYTLPIRRFREFKQRIPKERAFLKDKKIVTYCTGGIRCEKASAFLLSQGLNPVYQLKGGIIAYGAQTDGAFFEGRCYVFDERLHCAINQVKPTVVGRCYRCHRPSDRVINCTYLRCHKHILLCKTCAQAYADTCSEGCYQQLISPVCSTS